MSRLSSHRASAPQSHVGNWTPRRLRKEMDYSPTVSLTPIRDIGRFFKILSKPKQLEALELARQSHSMAKPDIDRRVYLLERAASHTNFA